MTTIKKIGTTPSASASDQGGTTRSKTREAAGQKPSAPDEAILTGQDPKGKVSAASQSGALQGSVSRSPKKTVAPSSDEESTGHFQNIEEAIGDYNKPAGAQQEQEAMAPNPVATPEAQAAGPNQGVSSVSAEEAKPAFAAFADMVIRASNLLGQQGVKVEPKALADVLTQANQKDPKNTVQNAAAALNIDPKILVDALAQSSKALQTQRAGLEQVNTVLQMNLAFIQDETLHLHMIEKMQAMNQQRVQFSSLPFLRS